MKKINNKFLLLASLIAFIGCSKNRLTETPPNFTTAETLYSSVDGFEAGINGLYSLVREERNGLNYVKTEPRLDSLHSDPRWQLLLRRMNLPVDSERDTTVK